MDIEQHRKYIEEMKTTIREVVNGKIDKLDTKLTDYIAEDTLWKETADPYIKLATNISGVWKFAIYIVGGLLVIMALYNNIK